MTDRVGQQLGNYRLTRLLGKGGFAEVYLGEHVYLETLAAIKVLLTQLASEDLEPFRLEAKRVAHLEHPHIVCKRYTLPKPTRGYTLSELTPVSF